MKLEYKELEIELALEGVIQVETFRLTQELNSHAFLTMKLLVDGEKAEHFVNMASVLPVIIRETKCTRGRVIFQGKMETVYTKVEKGLPFLYLEAYSYTKDWERTEKSRSFLNESMTYMDVVRKVLADYGRFDIKDEITGNALIPEMLLQYEESDWVFLRRLASHFGTSLLVEPSADCGKVYFGIPDINYGTELHKEDYVLEKDLFHYSRILEPLGVLSQEASKWNIQTRRYLQMGEAVSFNKILTWVTGMKIFTTNGELVYWYSLSRREGLRREKEKNPRIYGMSIPATVKERNGNQIRVHFDIDPLYEAGAGMKYFTYAIESSSFYCMPVEGSRVHIYFPEHDEQSAVAVHAIGSGGGKSKNPENKSFSDPSGSAMNMTSDTLSYAPDSSGSILLNLNKGGFLSLTGKNINIKAQKGMMAGGETPVRNLMISGENKVVLQVGDGGDDVVALEEKTDIKSGLVTHKADSCPEAVPSAAELKKELEKNDAADREANNNALTSALVAGKQQSKQKIIKGLTSLAKTVGLVVLTVSTGGLAAPLALAAGVKATIAVADMAEGFDGYSKVNALDASRPANFLRDTIFRGNQDAYDLVSTITDIVFDVVAGNALKNAAAAGKFSKFMCPKSQVANFVTQTGGSVIFGAITEYEATGSINVQNMAINLALGMFKGSAGSTLIGKAQKLVGSNSKYVEKAVGTAVGTVFGTAVDVTADALLPDREVNLKQSFQNNLIESGLGQLFAEPVDVASGAFLITAADFVLSDIREAIRIQRKYNSTNTEEGILGCGWSFPYEGKLYQNGKKLHTVLDSGYHVIFEWDGEKACNVTYGCGWFQLIKDKEGWLIKDRKEHRTYFYNSQGVLQVISDRNGQAIRFTYHGEGLEGITTALGYHLSLTMRNGRLVQMKDNMGRTMQYRYENGYLTDVIHMDQGITHYEYDEKGYLTKAVDQAKITYLENRYDGTGKMVLQTLANGDTYEAEYLDEERKVRVHSSVGDQTIVYEYGKKMEILSVLYEDGSATRYDYNEEGYRIRETDRLGYGKEWSYDKAGRVIEEGRAGWLKTSFCYDEADDLIEKTDNAGRKFLYEYDGSHNLIEAKEKAKEAGEWLTKSYIYDRKGRLLEERDALGNTTLYHYEEASGNPSVITYSDGEEVRFEYDIMGRMMAKEDDCGRKEYGYNAKNFRTMVRDGEGNESRYLYDGMGRLLAMYPPKAWKEQKEEYSYQYDFLDRLIDTIRPDGSHERQMRDGEGHILKKVHPNAYKKEIDDGEGIRYEYDSDGNQIRIRYPDGGCERFFYDANGKRIKHVLPEAYQEETDDGTGYCYDYDTAGNLAKIVAPEGNTEAEYTYDLCGNVLSHQNAMGLTAFYQYDFQNHLIQMLQPAKKEESRILYQRRTFSYDENGNKKKEVRHGGYWDQEGKLISQEGTDLCLSFAYDSRNRLIDVKDGLGAVVRYRYDARGNRVYEERQISDEVKQVIYYEYDKAGRLIEQKEELSSGLAPIPGEERFAVTRYRYDENGNRIEIITPEGYHILREYDSCDRLISERSVDKANGIDRTVHISYDKAGNIIKAARQGKGKEAWEIGYSYDLKDRITHVKDCLGPVFQYEYDKNDRTRKEIQPQAGEKHERTRGYLYRYDFTGNLLEKADMAGTILEKNEYLPDGNLSRRITADGNELNFIYGANGQETEIHTLRSREKGRALQTYTYDSRGRITGLVDGNQNLTGYDVDHWGRICRIQGADGGKEGYTYDYAGSITSTTDANGGIITYRYNSQGKVCEIIDQEGNSETFRYDKEGRMTLHTDRNGNQVKTAYNMDSNRVLEIGCDKEGKNRESRSWEYDTFGQLEKSAAGGFCYVYEYRPDGKLLKKMASGRILVSCTYHEDGSLKTLTDESGKTVSYGYDWRGELASITDEAGTTIVRYLHDLDGKLKEIVHSNGVRTSYEYDTDGNISRLATLLNAGQPLCDFQYEYDLNGNRTAKAGACLFPGEDSIKDTVIHYRYDSMNRLLEEEYDGEAICYRYDLCGNRLKKESLAEQETYRYNKRNQLTEHITSKDRMFFCYDLQGNLIEETGAGNRRYSYNSFNQQIKMEDRYGYVQEHLYDGEGLRAGITVREDRTHFVFYNGELLTESGSGEPCRSRYILGYGVAANEVEDQSGYHAYHLDEQNSTAYITGSHGQVENAYAYDSFGNLRGQAGDLRNRILYTGQQYDQEMGQYYLRARYYNPTIGRFTQEDVYRGDGLNLYAYCANNPVVYYDPSGYDEKCIGEGKKQDSKTVKEGSGGNEITYPTEKTHESARNTLMNELDKSGAFTNGSQPYTGRLESSYGYEQTIGRQSLDGKTRWRLDYDPDKGVHYNFEDFSQGKGSKAVKIAIPIDISYEKYKSIINLYNR